MRARGSGSVFQPKGSTIWWVQYYVDGRRERESSNSHKKGVAESLLKTRIGEIANGTFAPNANRTMVSELVDLVLTDYKVNKRDSHDHVERRWRLHLLPSFAHRRAASITYHDLIKYAEKRQADKASNAEINRELAILRRGYTLGRRARKVGIIPDFPRLEENNTREGFLTDDKFPKLADQCSKFGLWLRSMLELGYQFGWRSEEVTALKVERINLAEKSIRLERGETKANDIRDVVMPSTLYTLIVACCERKEPGDYVFTRENGHPVRDFRGAWAAATKAAGLEGLLFHDLRRSAVRNMIRRGIPRSHAMRISGHRTESVFERYNIIDDTDMKDAAAKLERNLDSAIVQPKSAPDSRQKEKGQESNEQAIQ